MTSFKELEGRVSDTLGKRIAGGINKIKKRKVDVVVGVSGLASGGES